MDIAFLFLTYQGIVHEKTKNWLKGKPVYLNTKEPSKHPRSYTVLSVPTEWGKRSIVDATLELLRVAYEHNHDWYMLLSHDAYPLVSYNALVKGLSKSMFHLMEQNTIGTEWKTSQWWCLSKSDVELILTRHKEYDAYLKVFPYQTRGAVDELYFLSCLKFLQPAYTYVEKKTIYVDWLNSIQKHPVEYGALLEGDMTRMKGSFFLRKTTPYFTSTLHVPKRTLVVQLYGNKSDTVPMDTDLILISMVKDIPDELVKRSLRIYHTLFVSLERAIREVLDRLPTYLWEHVLVNPEKSSTRARQPFPYSGPFPVDIPYQYRQPKIAFLFLTIGDMHQPDVWTRYFEGFTGKYSVYSHPKFPEKVKTPWLQEALIPERVDTGWGYITRAYECLFREAMKDPDNIKFVTISESCIPLKPFQSFYDYLKHGDERTSYVKFMRISQYDRQVRIESQPHYQDIPFFQKHYARMCLSRYHVNKLLNSPYLKFFHRMHVGDEFFLSSIGIQPHVDFVHPMEITYDNWEDTHERVLKLKEENRTLGNSAFDQDLYRRNKALQEEIGKNPKTYTTITTDEIETALHKESFFWRKFTAAPLPWTAGVLSILPHTRKKKSSHHKTVRRKP